MQQVAEKIQQELEIEEYKSKYKKRIKKKKHKIEKLKKKNKKLQQKNKELQIELERKNKKCKDLKQSIQMERYFYGVDPFIPTNTYKLFKKGKCKGKENLCHALTFSTKLPNLIQQSNNVIDVDCREV